jgi:hypothetical protein
VGCGIGGLRGRHWIGLGRRRGGGGFVPRCRRIEVCISIGFNQSWVQVAWDGVGGLGDKAG